VNLIVKIYSFFTRHSSQQTPLRIEEAARIVNVSTNPHWNVNGIQDVVHTTPTRVAKKWALLSPWSSTTVKRGINS